MQLTIWVGKVLLKIVDQQRDYLHKKVKISSRKKCKLYSISFRLDTNNVPSNVQQCSSINEKDKYVVICESSKRELTSYWKGGVTGCSAHFHYHSEDVMYDAEHESILYVLANEIPA